MKKEKEELNKELTKIKKDIDNFQQQNEEIKNNLEKLINEKRFQFCFIYGNFGKDRIQCQRIIC